MIKILLFTILSSFMFRFRGGLFGDYLKSKLSWWGTTSVRLIWATFMASPLLLHSFTLFLLGIVAWYLGIIFKWAPWQYMENSRNDIPAMGLRGVVLTFLPAVLVGIGIDLLSGVILLLSGFSLGLVYGLNSILLKKYTKYNLSGINEFAEWEFGAVIGLIVGVILL